jgi:hypothetical protein
MRTELRRLLRDVRATQWTNAQLDTQLQAAAGALWDECLDDPRLAPLLRTATAPAALVAYQDSYALPAAVLRVERVEYRQYTTLYAELRCAAAGTTNPATWAAVTAGSFRVMLDDVLYELTSINLTGVASMAAVATALQTKVRTATGGSETVTWDAANLRFVFAAYQRVGALAAASAGTDLSASNFLNGRAGAASVYVSPSALGWEPVPRAAPPAADSYRSGNTAQFGVSAVAGAPTGWFPALESGALLLWPASVSVNGLYRLWHYRAPAFPASDTAAFLFLPDGVDELVELGAAFRLASEELEDNQKPAFFRGLYREVYERLARGRGQPQRAARRYVQRVMG